MPWIENGDQLAHKLSSGHPNYSFKETQEYFDNASKLGGPTTCKHFKNLGNGLCKGCRHVVRSPINLVRGEG